MKTEAKNGIVKICNNRKLKDATMYFVVGQKGYGELRQKKRKNYINIVVITKDTTNGTSNF